VSNLSHRKSNYWFFWWFRVVSDLSPTLGKIGHQWFCLKKWYPWWQNQWFRLCCQRSHNSYKLFRRKNPPKILLTIFNFDLNVNKCPILPLFTVYWIASVENWYYVLSTRVSVLSYDLDPPTLANASVGELYIRGIERQRRGGWAIFHGKGSGGTQIIRQHRDCGTLCNFSTSVVQ
jgi:hypothetical protein